MTDLELKELVGSLAIAQREVTESIKELRKNQKESQEEQKKSQETLKKEQKQRQEAQEKEDKKREETLKKELKQRQEAQEKEDKKREETLKKELKQSQETLKKELEEREQTLKKEDEAFNKRIKKLEQLVGGIGQNQGDVAEEFFFNSLVENPKLGDITFSEIEAGARKHKGKTQEEYDLVLTNGDSIAIIEVKYKVHPNDIKKVKRKIENYRYLFPRDSNFKLYGAIAGFYIPSDPIEEAEKSGFFVLKRKGELIEAINSENLKVF